MLGAVVLSIIVAGVIGYRLSPTHRASVAATASLIATAVVIAFLVDPP
jgi:hypothetical protein